MRMPNKKDECLAESESLAETQPSLRIKSEGGAGVGDDAFTVLS
jgi:hypothetical protein